MANTLARKIAAGLQLLGVDWQQIASYRHVPKYIRGRREFEKMGGRIDLARPVLRDYAAQAGTASGHYFHQDLLVASLVHEQNPIRHLDVGSRIDGFVAHVASFRKIEVLDVRPLHIIGQPNIGFVQADLMKGPAENMLVDSISCLHAIEHFGLGRYGDRIDPVGHIKGYNNILQMLSVGGTLYISFPIGHRTEVQFNAHRVFNPHDIFSWSRERGNVRLVRFDYVDDLGQLHRDANLDSVPALRFGCGIYTLTKIR